MQYEQFGQFRFGKNARAPFAFSMAQTPQLSFRAERGMFLNVWFSSAERIFTFVISQFPRTS
jgi:hypothetical protein